MSRSAVTAVLFDLDGTLLDTAPDLVGSLNALRVSEGLPAAPVAEYRRFVSRGALGLIRAGLPDRGPDAEAEWRRRFLAHYERNSLVDTKPFDGVERILGALEAQGIAWGIVTNKPEFLTLPIVDALGWASRAACVVCGDTLAVSKPDPAPVLLACERAGAQPSASLMVGDDPRDLEAGEAAGARSVLAAYGYGAQEVLDAGRAVHAVIARPEDLLACLEADDGARSAN